MDSLVQSGEPQPPLPAKSLSIFERIKFGVQLWTFKIFVIVALRVLRWVKQSHFQKIAPTYTKTYDTRPGLRHRVFIPKDWKTGERLPLYINIHGGGFAISDATIVSLNYRDAPLYPFPIPVHDVAALISAVLSDPELPVNSANPAAAGGFSAGGNLVLAATQLGSLQGKIKGLVPIYPVVDFSKPRVYKKSKSGKPDILEKTGKLFDWAYITAGTNRRDTLLSPIYARRETLPQKIFFVGAEEDVLCDGDEIMANQLGQQEGAERNGDESNFTQGGIRWKKVPQQQHGFTHIAQKGREEEERQQVCKRLYKDIAEWLNHEVY
ncbi:MAG: hypothetical protein Q9227_002677 [Pyrenula ochraceoflavens]